MDVVTITIPGKPVQKDRPRINTRGNKPRVFNGQREQEKVFKALLLDEYDGKILTGPLSINFEFVFDRPKSHFGTGKNISKLKKKASKYHVVKPDKDNLEKFALDCMEGIVFVNDSQVITGITSKRYTNRNGEDAHTYITIYIYEY